MTALPLRVGTGSPPHWAIRALWVVATLAFVVYIPTQADTSTIGLISYGFELAVAVLGLNLVMGYGGIISLGHSAFFALGGYTVAILVDTYGWSHAFTFPVAIVVGFVVGCVVSLPALRLRGIYLALVTLGLAVLFPLLVGWEKLEWLTSGTRGISGVSYDEVPLLPLVGREDRPSEERAIFMYWLAAFALVAAYLVVRGIVKSRVGRSLIAIRDNETAAAVMGVDLARTKTLVFGVSAALCALAGSLFTIRGGIANANLIPMFTLLGSILLLVVMTLGGAATLWGPLVGAVGYVWLDDTARAWGAGGGGEEGSWVARRLHDVFGWITGSPAAFIVALVLLGMMFVAPFGIVGLLRRLAAKVVVLVPRPAGSAATVPPVEPPVLAAPDPLGSGTTRGTTPRTPGGEP